MRTIAIATNKGGTGKTTTAVNLSACLAERGRRVLLIDLGPQCDATGWLNREYNSKPGKSVLDALMGECQLEGLIVATDFDGLDLVPAFPTLSQANIKMSSIMAREQQLRLLLEELPSQWDYVIIDCPPGLELLTLNALVAADEVIIPSPTEELPTRGLKAMWQFISEIRRARLNESLCVLGVLPTMHIKNVHP